MFDNIKDFVEGVKKFGKRAYQIGCVQDIVRTKNDFGKYKDSYLRLLDLDSFDYCDIKFNLLIEFNGVKVYI